MTVNLSMLAGASAQFLDNNGTPLAGGLVYTYAAGTTTPQATYTTNSGLTAHTNPIVLDSAGRVSSGGEIWLTDAQAYKFVVQTSAAITIGTYDNITGNGSGILASLAAPNGSSLVGFIASGAEAVATTVQTKLRETVSVKDFGAVGDGFADDTAAIVNAIAQGGEIFFPRGIYKVTTTIIVPTGTRLTGESDAGTNPTIIRFTPDSGQVNLFQFNGADDCAFSFIRFEGPGRSTGTNEVGFNMDDNLSSGSERQITIDHCRFISFNRAGIILSGQWHVTVRNCTFSSCGDPSTPVAGTGGIVFLTSPALSGWAGSGNIFSDNYFGSCSYGVWDASGWDVVHINNIWEYCYRALYIGASGSQRTFIACWFENNDNPPEILGSVNFLSGRGVDWTDHNVTFDDRGSFSTSSAGIVSYRSNTPTMRWNPRDGFTVFKSLRENGTGFSFDTSTSTYYYADNTNDIVPTVDLTLNNQSAIQAGARNRNSSFQQVLSLDGYAGYFSPNFTQVTSGTISAATNTNPVVLTVGSTTGSAKLLTGDIIKIDGVVGMTELNGNTYKITVTGATTVELDGVDGTGYGTYTSGGAWDSNRRRYRVASVAALTRSTVSGSGSGYGLVGFYTGQHNGSTDNNTQLRWYVNYTGDILPAEDDEYNFGSASLRPKEIFAVAPAINTSDANQKQQIQDLSAAEQHVAQAIKGLFKTFKYNDAVAKKGDDARIHIGVIAQDVERAFIDNGLDPARYALFCRDIWYELDGQVQPESEVDADEMVTFRKWLLDGQEVTHDEDGNLPDGAVERIEKRQAIRKEQLGIRYGELLAFVIAAM
jgi:hypothetical protein